MILSQGSFQVQIAGHDRGIDLVHLCIPSDTTIQETTATIDMAEIDENEMIEAMMIDDMVVAEVLASLEISIGTFRGEILRHVQDR
jgi:hypothetical protein